MSLNVCSEALSGHFGVFAKPQEESVKRSSKNLAEGRQRVHVDWTKTRKVVGSRLVEALAVRASSSRRRLPMGWHYGRGRKF